MTLQDQYAPSKFNTIS